MGSFFVAYFATGVLTVSAHSDGSRFFVGWKREYNDRILKNGKLFKIDPQPVQYHLIIFSQDSGGSFRLRELPAFINEKAGDTSYSASEGGYFRGKGSYRLAGDTLHLAGKYTCISYSRGWIQAKRSGSRMYRKAESTN